MIFTFGDGFATGHIWPEWPQILQALLPDRKIINIAEIGVGPEFLVSGLVDQLQSMKGQTAIVQWPAPDRFDKLLQDSSWDILIENDAKYYFNRVQDSHKRIWWLSSGSDNLKEYHNHWVQLQQHTRRLDMYKALVQNTLDNIACRFLFTSTQDLDDFSQQPRFNNVRQNHIQPSPIVHFYWLLEEVCPTLNILIDSQRMRWIEKQISNTTWIAYDPERETHWNSIIHAE
jgi:hypothetical protein